jgi:hypothetical protein
MRAEGSAKAGGPMCDVLERLLACSLCRVHPLDAPTALWHISSLLQFLHAAPAAGSSVFPDLDAHNTNAGKQPDG